MADNPVSQPTVDQNQYKCAACGGTFEKGWSEEEARAELAEVFPGFGVEDCSVVCDDCYKAMGFGGCEKTTGTRRILARVEQPEFEAPESEWINSRTSFLGEHFGMASRSIQALIDDGSMIVVRTERITDG